MTGILAVAILLFSIILHEYFHGWAAYKLGDPTPKLSGRITLNPFVHVDLIGTIILPVLLLILSQGKFSMGYAKPVPINPYNFKNPRKDIMRVGIAGPLVNICLSVLFAVTAKLSTGIPYFYNLLLYGLTINLILAIFNLLPLPSFDGGRILTSVLPFKIALRYQKEKIPGIIFLLLLVSTGFIRWFVFPLVKAGFSLFRIDFPRI